MALRTDPAACGLISRAMEADVRRAMGGLARKVWRAVAVAGHISHPWLDDDAKAAALQDFVDQEVRDVVLAAEAWCRKHVGRAYRKGALRAFRDANRADALREPAVQSGLAEAFLRSFAHNGRTQEVPGRVRNARNPSLLSARMRSMVLARKAHGNFRGLAEDARKAIAQEVTRGLLAGDHPYTIARRMTKKVRGLAKARARTIARTEVIGAHAQGQLDSFRAQGLDKVGLMAEWSTAKDSRVCPECEDMEGQQFTLDEAEGMIPLHPNCRCAWVPGTPESVREGADTTRGESSEPAAKAKKTKHKKHRRRKKTTDSLRPGDVKERAAELIGELGARAKERRKRRGRLRTNARRGKLTKKQRMRLVGYRPPRRPVGDPTTMYSSAADLGTPARPNDGGFSTW